MSCGMLSSPPNLMLMCDVEVTAAVLLGSCCSYGTPSKKGQSYDSFTLQRPAFPSVEMRLWMTFSKIITLVTIMCYLSLKLDMSQRRGDTLWIIIIANSWGFPPSFISSCLPVLPFFPFSLPPQLFPCHNHHLVWQWPIASLNDHTAGRNRFYFSRRQFCSRSHTS